jgi:hypothetical protein
VFRLKINHAWDAQAICVEFLGSVLVVAKYLESSSIQRSSWACHHLHCGSLCSWRTRAAATTPMQLFTVVATVACQDTSVSPSAKIATWRYWFRLSRDVYGGNRSFASYTKAKTVESAVWCLLTRLDDGDSQQVTGTSRTTGSKYSMLQSWNCRRGWCCRRWRCRWVRTTITDHRSVWQRCGIWGLAQKTSGGGGVLTHYLITWREMDGQHDTRKGSSRWDPAHCWKFLFFSLTAVRQ